MATITIRNLDDRVKETIRLKAAKSGHSMEEEARRLLDETSARDGSNEVLRSTRRRLGLR